MEISIGKPTYAGQQKEYEAGSVTLKTIIDGSTTKQLEFGSEVLIYAELALDTGFKVSYYGFSKCSLRFVIGRIGLLQRQIQ